MTATVEKDSNLTPEELADIIRPIASQYKVTGVSLFGSRARGDYREDSDYDFLIDVLDDFSFGDHGAFIEDLMEALQTPVDVITRRSLTDCEFDRLILEDAVRVF